MTGGTESKTDQGRREAENVARCRFLGPDEGAVNGSRIAHGAGEMKQVDARASGETTDRGNEPKSTKSGSARRTHLTKA